MNKPQMNHALRIRIQEKFETQSLFAWTIGERENAVSRIVRGWKQIPKDRKKIWAEALGCEVEELEDLGSDRVNRETEVSS